LGSAKEEHPNRIARIILTLDRTPQVFGANCTKIPGESSAAIDAGTVELKGFLWDFSLLGRS